MSSYEIEDIIIYINMFVHYPETYNANTISNNFNKFFKKSFIENNILDFIYNQNCYVMINSAPHNVDESMKIEICLDKDKVTLINKEIAILNLKKFIVDYFNNQIKDINVELIFNK